MGGGGGSVRGRRGVSRGPGGGHTHRQGATFARHHVGLFLTLCPALTTPPYAPHNTESCGNKTRRKKTPKEKKKKEEEKLKACPTCACNLTDVTAGRAPHLHDVPCAATAPTLPVGAISLCVLVVIRSCSIKLELRGHALGHASLGAAARVAFWNEARRRESGTISSECTPEHPTCK